MLMTPQLDANGLHIWVIFFNTVSEDQCRSSMHSMLEMQDTSESLLVQHSDLLKINLVNYLAIL